MALAVHTKGGAEGGGRREACCGLIAQRPLTCFAGHSSELGARQVCCSLGNRLLTGCLVKGDCLVNSKRTAWFCVSATRIQLCTDVCHFACCHTFSG